MGRGKHKKTGAPTINCGMRLPDYVWNALKKLGDGKGLAAGCIKMHALWTASNSKEVARIQELMDQPPVCKVCGTPMQAKTVPAKVNLNGTALMQTIIWTCSKCYDAYELECDYAEPVRPGVQKVI